MSSIFFTRSKIRIFVPTTYGLTSVALIVKTAALQPRLFDWIAILMYKMIVRIKHIFAFITEPHVLTKTVKT